MDLFSLVSLYLQPVPCPSKRCPEVSTSFLFPMVVLSEPPGVDSVQLLRLDSHGDELHLSPILLRNVAPTCSTSLCNAAISQNVSSVTSSAQTTFTTAAAIASITPYSRIDYHPPYRTHTFSPSQSGSPSSGSSMFQSTTLSETADITSDFSPSPGVTAASSLFPVLPSLSSVPSSSVLPSTSLPSSSSLASHDHTGAIVGGVIGGCAALVIVIVSAVLLRRHLRNRHTAPSAEFMAIAAASGSPSSDRHFSLARQTSLEDDQLPPAFTRGGYTDPVYEKVQASAAAREAYSSGSAGAKPERSLWID